MKPATSLCSWHFSEGTRRCTNSSPTSAARQPAKTTRTPKTTVKTTVIATGYPLSCRLAGCSHISRGDTKVRETACSTSFLEEFFSETGFSGVRHSRKPNLWYYSSLEAPYIGVILCAADRGNVVCSRLKDASGCCVQRFLSEILFSRARW